MHTREEASKLYPQFPVTESQGLTVDKLQRFMPRGRSEKVTEEVVAMLNRTEQDSGGQIDQYAFEEKLMENMHHLNTQGADITALANATKFVMLSSMMSNKKAFEIVFPERVRRLTLENKSVDNACAMYNQTKLVTKIAAQAMLHPRLTNQGTLYEMIEIQANLARGMGAGGVPVSGTVQQLASAKLIDYLTIPEDVGIQLKVGLDDETKSVQQDVLAQLRKISEQQANSAAIGGNLDEIQKIGVNVRQESEIVEDAEVIDASYSFDKSSMSQAPVEPVVIPPAHVPNITTSEDI